MAVRRSGHRYMTSMGLWSHTCPGQACAEHVVSTYTPDRCYGTYSLSSEPQTGDPRRHQRKIQRSSSSRIRTPAKPPPDAGPLTPFLTSRASQNLKKSPFGPLSGCKICQLKKFCWTVVSSAGDRGEARRSKRTSRSKVVVNVVPETLKPERRLEGGD